ncbi:formamidopyrimidine-DNA glycosylase [Terriglobus roseus DSM 18391]|uniref:DNA-(apurinic or apyrimidinic site) lyase n=1 Tax=Terriglobus roseus (strain DSM 18391 / NRRL B-41598 / KBS 63) TaxID=926566 RepID=I3ZCU1_TERRK|nr:DNA-formamidopyrimidine glycosylase family protein [Terriglobus roseus]AFL87059.1 formamidopyrimidine-DNA glycosylase [Terriglobus roseus DSM 18391]
MPEGDTIYRSARALAKVLTGKHVTKFDTGYAHLATVNDDRPVAGRIIEKVEANGKWLLMHFSGDLILVTHMLMSGSWHIYKTGEKWWSPRKAMRALIEVDGWQAVAFNVPVAEFHTAASLARKSSVPRLGPDILSDSYTTDIGFHALQERAASHPEDEIANVLLNQRVIAGLGNVYKSEVAFAARVHPFRHMSTLSMDEMRQMADVSQRYMKANILDGSGDGIITYSGNRRTTHSANREERLWVYGRRGKECRRCGGIIEYRKQGPGARSTYWCPECQPWVGEGEAVKGRDTPIRRTRMSC